MKPPGAALIALYATTMLTLLISLAQPSYATPAPNPPAPALPTAQSGTPNRDVAKVAVPKIAVPKIAVPKIAVPSVAIPKTPKVAVPSVTIPNVTIPTLPPIDQITHVGLPPNSTSGHRSTGTSTNEFAIGQNGLDASRGRTLPSRAAVTPATSLATGSTGHKPSRSAIGTAQIEARSDSATPDTGAVHDLSTVLAALITLLTCLAAALIIRRHRARSATTVQTPSVPASPSR